MTARFAVDRLGTTTDLDAPEIGGKPFHGWSCDCDECEIADSLGEPRRGEVPADIGAEVAARAAAFSAWLDATYQPDVCDEARLWRRITKVDEESGEVQQALRAYLNENPRKPAGRIEDVISELADVAACALGALEHLTGNRGQSLKHVLERQRFTCDRVGVSIAA